MQNLAMKSILKLERKMFKKIINFLKGIFKKENPVHYGRILEDMLAILLNYQVRVKNTKYVGYEKDIETLEGLIIQLDDLLDLLEEEEKTSHIRSKFYLQKQKEFFQNFNDKIPSIFI